MGWPIKLQGATMNIDCVHCKARIDSFETLMTGNASLADIRLAPDKWTLNDCEPCMIRDA
jgi:hypothetical protein